MVDPRVARLADLIAKYCVEIKHGEEALVTATTEALPLVAEVCRAVLQRGGYPIVMLHDEVLEEVFYRYADEELLKHVSPIERFIMEHIDVRIAIHAPTHKKHLSTVPPERMRIRSAARRELTEIFMRRSAEGKLKWVVAPFPTRAMAQEAGMSFMDYEEFVFRACMVNREDPVAAWQEQARRQQRIAEMLSKVSELRIVAEDTDFTIRVDGRKWINDDGKKNMPGGEVFTAPIEDSVEGQIRFTYPAIWRGVEVEDVRLTFKRGEVVKAEAARGEEFLRKMLEVDEGARRVGEFAFGLNYGIDRFTKDILFDEKIGGTIHLALGAAYPETGGRNVSAIHWDMIKDMRRGKVYADGDLIYENGRFLI